MKLSLGRSKATCGETKTAPEGTFVAGAIYVCDKSRGHKGPHSGDRVDVKDGTGSSWESFTVPRNPPT